MVLIVKGLVSMHVSGNRTKFDPLFIINSQQEVLVEASKDSPYIVSGLVKELEDVAVAEAFEELVLSRLARALRVIKSRPWFRRVLHVDGVVLEPQFLSRLLLRLSVLMHLAYLATGSKEARLAGIYLYSGHRLVEAVAEPDTHQFRRAVQGFVAAGQLLLEGRIEEALALLARSLRGRLHIEPALDNARLWAAALQASYLLDVAPHAEGELLDAWGYYDLLDKALEDAL